MDDNTVKINDFNKELKREKMLSVIKALEENGYNPVSQIAGFLSTGDPVYITSKKNARSVVASFEWIELLEEIVECYVNCLKENHKHKK